MIDREFTIEFTGREQRISVTFKESNQGFTPGFGEIHQIPMDVVPYEGDYRVTPTVDGSVLKTRDKFMADDLTVEPIPYFDTSNTAGGRTIYIADEV